MEERTQNDKQKLEEKYINNVPCCNEEDCEMFKDYMVLKQQLKDKDEKISKAIEYIKRETKELYSRNRSCKYLGEIMQLENTLEILETNKED